MTQDIKEGTHTCAGSFKQLKNFICLKYFIKFEEVWVATDFS